VLASVVQGDAVNCNTSDYWSDSGCHQFNRNLSVLLLKKWPRRLLQALPDEYFSKKTNNAKKRPEKGQTNCSKASKKPNFICGIESSLSHKHL